MNRFPPSPFLDSFLITDLLCSIRQALRLSTENSTSCREIAP